MLLWLGILFATYVKMIKTLPFDIQDKVNKSWQKQIYFNRAAMKSMLVGHTAMCGKVCQILVKGREKVT